ncbi:MAG: tetratricopeptide repeat protein [Deltaproteobacteria bacterium]|nr:tetratricopeptide repeat protein [Deltaproteobacteria bacterium]
MSNIRYLPKYILVLALIVFFAGPLWAQDIETAGKFYKAKQYLEAYSKFENAYIKDSGDMTALNGMAWCKFQMGKLKKARAMFKSILRKQPYHTGATQGIAAVNAKIYGNFNAALAKSNTGNYDGAIKAFQAILDDQNRLMPEKELYKVYLQMGYTYYKKNDRFQARRYFNRSLNLEDNFDAHKGLGLIAYYEKNYDQAVSAFKESLKLYPAQYDVASLIAWCQFKKGDNKNAIKGFKNQVAINPYIADAHYGLGLALHKKGEKKSAVEQFYAVVSLLPGYLATNEFYNILKNEKEYKPLYMDLGWALYFTGLADQSFKVFKKGLKYDPENAVLLRGAGYAAYSLKNYDESIAYCQKSLSKNDSLPAIFETGYTRTGLPYKFHSDARSTMAWAYFYKQDYANAMANFKKTIKLHPKWPDANNGLGWIYYSQKKYDNAEKYFRAALKADPAYNDAYNGLAAVSKARIGRSGEGWKYYYLSQFDKSIKKFDRIMAGKDATKDEKLSAKRGLGWSYLKLDKYKDAGRYFNWLIKQDRKDFDAILGLGYVYYGEKKYNKAADTLGLAVKMFPMDVNAAIAYGWSLYHVKKFSESLMEFSKAIRLYPGIAEPYRGTGYSQVKLGKVNEGRLSIITAINIFPKTVDNDTFTSLVQENPGLKDLYITLAWSYYNSGLYPDALKNAKLIDVEYPDLDMLFGFIYFANKQYNNAIQLLENFLTQSPGTEKGYGKYSKSLYDLGWSYYNEKNYSKSLEIFEKFVKLHKDDDIWAAPYDGMGWSYLKIGDAPRAEINFKESLKRTPGYANSLAGLKVLKKLKK